MRRICPRADDASSSFGYPPEIRGGITLQSAGLSHLGTAAQAEALQLVSAAERRERDPKGLRQSISTSVDSVRGPRLPQAPDALL